MSSYCSFVPTGPTYWNRGPSNPRQYLWNFSAVCLNAPLLRLLTPKNRELLAIIRDRKPRSIAELAEMTGRKPPNVTRTLGKLEAVGFVRMKTVKHRKVPTAAVRAFRISIDPFSQNDRLEFA